MIKEVQNKNDWANRVGNFKIFYLENMFRNWQFVERLDLVLIFWYQVYFSLQKKRKLCQKRQFSDDNIWMVTVNEKIVMVTRK